MKIAVFLALITIAINITRTLRKAAVAGKE